MQEHGADTPNCSASLVADLNMLEALGRGHYSSSDEDEEEEEGEEASEDHEAAKPGLD